MEPCLELSLLQTDLCCWGRHAVVPVETNTFCKFHKLHFLQYTLACYFNHAAKIALFVSTPNSFYLIVRADLEQYFVTMWKAKNLPLTQVNMRPLHFRNKNSGLFGFESVVELLEYLPQYQISAILQTSLKSIDALRNVVLPLQPFDLRRLPFDASVPAFVTQPLECVSPDVLAAPFVMLINGSTTPDPRFYSSGTQCLWNTLTSSKKASGTAPKVAPLSKLRYGVMVQQTKMVVESKQNDDDTTKTKGGHEQFECDL